MSDDDDDLDELLDEVERKFCSKASVGAFGRGSSHSRTFGSDGTGKSKEGATTANQLPPTDPSLVLHFLLSHTTTFITSQMFTLQTSPVFCPAPAGSSSVSPLQLPPLHTFSSPQLSDLLTSSSTQPNPDQTHFLPGIRQKPCGQYPSSSRCEYKIKPNISLIPLTLMQLSSPGLRESFTFDHPEPLSSSVSDDIDAFLEDLLEDGGDGGGEGLQAQHCPKGTPVERPLPPPGGRRCCPVYLGGSGTRCGVGTAAAQRSCDQLRCTTCDFRVLKFDDCRWDVSCDYLFLRNNMPERHKLRSRLKSSSGWRAYACQCSWESTEQLIQLQDRPRLTWVCGGHPH
ncbi:cilia- and flagella-associated protein 418 isoform X2 [Nelusetta ayraudi]|uniref:cilia- and flagella-associated protein 418 isoform X2 n=1 Tax=Nelusetta ayraudi TaxID=303726 RepID=UPI003F7002BB